MNVLICIDRRLGRKVNPLPGFLKRERFSHIYDNLTSTRLTLTRSSRNPAT